jgi:protein involved in polysaccharide export with SLBB domain
LDRGIITRINETTNERQTIIFDVSGVIGDEPSDQNILLEKNDIVEIFSKIEFRDTFTLNISGEVHSPGEFEFSTEMTLKDLIFKAGGLSTSAINSKIEIIRSFKFGEDMIKLEPIPAQIILIEVGAVLDLKKAFEDFVLYPFDQVSVRKNPYYLESRKVSLTGAVMYPGEYTLLSENEKLSSLIDRAGGLRSYAFPGGLVFTRVTGDEEVTNIITNLEKALRNPKSSYNYILLEDDEIHIPIANDLISISGNIMNEDKQHLSIYYKKHRRAKHYITKYAGGFKERSMKRKTYVKYADGTAKRTKNYLFFKVYPKPKPGSAIFVIRNKKSKRGRMGSILENATEKMTAIFGLVLMYAIIQQSFK